MLINTVLMFLRELLPLFLLLATLLVWHRNQWQRFVLLFAILATVMLLLISSNMMWLAEQLDGRGLELLYSLLYGGCFIFLCLAAAKPAVAMLLCVCASVCLMSINGSNLLLYIWLPAQGGSELSGLLLGMALGVGIGSSIAVLWYYLVTELKQWYSVSFSLLLALLGVRQVIMALALLIQSDWLPAGPQLWQTEQWLAEQSELGFFLQALLGYEATPVLSQGLAYIAGLGLLLWCGRNLKNISRSAQ